MRVQSDLYEVSEVLFLKIPYLKSSIRHSVSLYVNRVSEARDLRGQIPRGHATWNLAISGRRNRASKARFRGPKSSL